MRNAFCTAMCAEFQKKPFAFFTGDLGFMALEPLKEVMGGHFINAGIAEQNMIGVAAGMALHGITSWAYSIAPFVYARPFEQIRNDICMHSADVKLVGNGGGYGYGYMGSTHHALEDYGVMASLRGMRCFLPAFNSDVPTIIQYLNNTPGPAYLRLGRDEAPPEWVRPQYEPWRRLVVGKKGIIVTAGAITSSLIKDLLGQPLTERPSLWSVGEIPIPRLPEQLLVEICNNDLHVVEEHVAQGGIGHSVAAILMEQAILPKVFCHSYAKPQNHKGYGTQQWHRKQDGLDTHTIFHNQASG